MKIKNITYKLIIIAFGLLLTVSNANSGIFLSYLDKNGQEIPIAEYLIWYEVPKKIIKKITQPNSNIIIKVVDYDEQILKPTLNGKIIRSINLSPNDENIVYAGLKGHKKGAGKVLKSNNNAKDWITLNKDKALSKGSKDVQVVAESPHNPDIIYAGTWNNGFYKSVDKGIHFEKIKKFPALDIRSVIFHEKDKNLILAATTTHGIVFSTDAGKKWQVRTPKYLEHNFSRTWKLVQSPYDQNTLFALTFGGLYVSHDFSASWTKLISSPGDTFSAITFENESTIYVTSGGLKTEKSFIYISIDEGKSFIRYKKGINDFINDMVVVNGNVLFGGDNGMYELKGNELIPSTIAVPFPTISQFILKGEYLWIATWGNGIIKKKIAALFK